MKDDNEKCVKAGCTNEGSGYGKRCGATREQERGGGGGGNAGLSMVARQRRMHAATERRRAGEGEKQGQQEGKTEDDVYMPFDWQKTGGEVKRYSENRKTKG